MAMTKLIRNACCAAALLSGASTFGSAAAPPELEVLDTIKDQLWIGISPVSRNTIWVAGENGTVARSTDAGKSWQYFQPGPADLQFRDIEAIDDRRAYAMSVGNGGQSRIYYTDNGGNSWRLRYRGESDSFFNCMALAPSGEAWVHGDSVGDEWRMVRSADGRNWMQVRSAVAEPPQSNEGGFASSGSCARFNNDTWMIATGNADKARVLVKGSFGIRFKVIDSPMQAGPMAGITSVWPDDEDNFYIAGGSLSEEIDEQEAPRLWRYSNEEFKALPEPPLSGALYSLSKVSHDGDWLLTSNPQGAAALNIASGQWHPLSDKNIWNIQCHGNISCWFVGKDGFIARLLWQPASSKEPSPP
ncbi:hypothetical protein [Idiomarina sp. 29L]|uniref:WD40/YVTN/BNR-like repeat-containing protein n=1 Tax=Idiomarina sp. 29L TaxID=2508877 RepID=UPI001F0C7B56|nr:hypothetical protein [Idiomarina sp. 29L]